MIYPLFTSFSFWLGWAAGFIAGVLFALLIGMSFLYRALRMLKAI